MTKTPFGKREAPFSLRLSFEERAKLEQQAGSMPLSAYIKSLLFADDAPVYRQRRRVPGLAIIAGLIVLFGNGAVSWGLAWALGYIAFLAGLGYWARGVVKKLAETPTTFGSAKWADAEHLKANKVFDPKPEPVSDPKPRAPAGNAWMAAQSTMSGGILPKFPDLSEAKAAPFQNFNSARAKPRATPKPSKQGIRMGFAHDGMTEEPFYYREDGHLLTVAPSRAGMVCT